jgi:aerobic carbon-monoxide dehydrogenase large subunit
VVAEWDASFNRLTVWMSTQAVHHVREHLSVSLGLRPDQIHVIAPDVGGAFGTKEHLYPDEVLVCAAAIRLGRPVRWIEDRYEHFTATLHARDQTHDAVLALDADGRFLAMWSDIVHDLGAHPSNVGSGPAQVASNMLQGPYRVERAGTHARCVLTNRTPTGAYRGFGMQQAAWVRERLVDEAARELGIDPVELRRRNMLRSEELPFTTRFTQTYDSGDYVAGLEDAEEAMRSAPAATEDGRRRGVGYASHVEFTGLGPSEIQQLVGFHLNGFETSVVRLELDGSATVLTGGSLIGQGLETSLAQLAADQLGIALEQVRVLAGDSDLVPYSSAGSIASRSMVVAGGALVRASGELRSKIAEIAAHRLEADPQDIVLESGSAFVRGTPARSIGFADLAKSAWLGWDLPEGVAPGLEVSATYDPPDITYSYATHAAQVAVDPETGVVEIERYAVAHDCGVVVNPMIADGQLQGGVAQGIGIATLEHFTYDDDGQPSMSTYLDYLLPLSSDVPTVEIHHRETPSPHTPGGMKGLGEGGVIPTPAAIANAIAAALPEIAGSLLETPITPSTIVELLLRNAESDPAEAAP